ncbi:hypothetical protein ACN47E_004529 [Coniothyrium glycines]
MPAISSRSVEAGILHAREWRNTVGQSGMTPTAFAFLIPVFVVAIAAPFLCVFCIRKRRQATPVAPRAAKKPALRRAEARERLDSVTEVSNVTTTTTTTVQEADPSPASAVKADAAETRSVLERECAICLSALYAPSPPEPALLASSPDSNPTSPVTDPPATNPPSTTDTTPATPEQILKLRVCGHEFHAECLVSWVVLRKTSCPICRAVYLSKEEMQLLDNEAGAPGPAEQENSPTTTVTPAAVEAQTPIPISNWRYFVHGHSVFSRQGQTQAQRQGTQMQSLRRG